MLKGKLTKTTKVCIRDLDETLECRCSKRGAPRAWGVVLLLVAFLAQPYDGHKIICGILVLRSILSYIQKYSSTARYSMFRKARVYLVEDSRKSEAPKCYTKEKAEYLQNVN